MMDDRESPFVRTQASRSLIRPQTGARKFLMPSPADKTVRHLANRQTVGESEMNPMGTSKRLSAPHTPFESLKQWELVENDKGLQVVEKRAGALNPIRSKEMIPTSPLYVRDSSAKRLLSDTNVDANLEEKLRIFNESKILQPIGLSFGQQRMDLATPVPPLAEPKAPLSLDLILKQQQIASTGTTTLESTDMLQRLEQQVKAIEMSTIAARTRQLENSSDFGAEVQLRYREHEDLLRNATDDEAEGISLLHRGDATRNSTGNAGIVPKKPTVKLSRTASDTRRGQETEMRTQSRMPQTRAIVRPIVTKKDHQRQQQSQQQNNAMTVPLRPLSDMQKGIQSEKEVDI